MAIAFKGDLICVSNPLTNKSSVHVWRIDTEAITATATSSSSLNSQKLLTYQGYMVGLEGVIVTCLELDEEYLWVGTADGDLFVYSHLDGNSSLPLTLQTRPERKWKFQDTIISLHLNQEIGYGLVTTATGSVELLSIDDDDDDYDDNDGDNNSSSNKAICSLYPPLNSKENVLSAILAQFNHPTDNNNNDDDKKENNSSYAIVCGGGDGSIWIQPLNMDQFGELSDEQPFKDPLKQISPPHLGPVKCLASPLPGLLVSGGLDGSVRVWDIQENEGDNGSGGGSGNNSSSSSLYQFVGYKIWLGSMWTDGFHLITDGSDNTVIVVCYCVCLLLFFFLLLTLMFLSLTMICCCFVLYLLFILKSA